MKIPEHPLNDPAERSRDYLINARRCADLANNAYLPAVEGTTGDDKEWVVLLGVMNALLAIAEATVPPPPDLRG